MVKSASPRPDNVSISGESRACSYDGKFEHSAMYLEPAEEKLGLVRNASNTSAFINIVCVVAGSGTLGIPYALRQSGWIGLFLLMLSAVMSNYAGALLIKCLYYDPKRRLSGFPEIGYEAFGKAGRALVLAFNYTLLLTTPVLYLILAGDNLAALMQPLNVPITMKAWVWILTVAVCIPFIVVKNMKEVAVMSFFGSLATVCVVIVVAVMSVADFEQTRMDHQHDIARPRYFPIALCMFAFSYGGNVIYPQVEESMRDPKSWNKVLLAANFLITSMYILTGVPCYLVYGNTVKSPVYASIPSGAPQNIAMVVITIHVLLAIPIYLFSFTMEIERMLGITQANERFSKLTWLTFRTILRIAELCFCATIAIIIPFFGDFMALLGALASGFLLLVFPCLFYVKLFGLARIGWVNFVACICICIIGVLCAAIGTVDAITALVKDFQGVA
ncbi:hypothetical protein K450DRAFT_282713 [Umbelopsis ramanniana AG]|uniref:Amino acid transporter transmembrane domain-containing protein n=1 Tax=Umbelopsis ramanniana AG TaxID=1314678 RepID=A0AAD5E5N9_UMBRA|nr:uncharacterized protein K450DRAFT_282713 [Umbelopsis ramanniana AG]KAI8577327.1 hypothetical protein K450DRAFT_282713 [Umbelopsis ramanniana AG]